MRIDAFASQPHYAAHLRPVFDALDPSERGTFYGPGGVPSVPGNGRDAVLVCAYSDLQRVRHRPVVYMEHGASQEYETPNPAYAGGTDRGGVVLMLAPNERNRQTNAAAHPDIPCEVVGSPILDAMRHRPRDENTVVFAWHWDCRMWGASRSAFAHFRPGLYAAVQELRGDGWDVIGHGHPRAFDKAPNLRPWYESWGVPIVEDFRDALSLADVLVGDNTSAQWLSAALGVRQVALEAPWYSEAREQRLWPRWAVDLGTYAYGPEDIPAAVAASTVPDVSAVVPYTSGCAERAVAAIREHVLR